MSALDPAAGRDPTVPTTSGFGYLREQLITLGRMGRDDRFEPLSGGVSGFVALVRRDRAPFVAKTARFRLAVEDDWYADPVRTCREAEILSVLDGRLGPMRVPRVIFYDEPTNILGIEAFVPLPPTWKELLLAGEVDPSVVLAVAGAAAALHRLPAPAGLDVDQGARLFEELRLDPYYRAVAERIRELSDALGILVESTRRPDHPTLVHGDLTPKNVLILDDGPVLLDFEVIHHGDPAFDLGMLAGHLVLKALFLGESQASMSLAESVDTLWRHYLRHGGPALEDRVVRHLGGILLSRILGKSTVAYLSEERANTAIRLGRGLLEGAYRLDDVARLIRLETR